MNFSHDSDTLDLREGARDFLRERYTFDVLRDLVERDDSADSRWQQLVELCLVGLTAPETCSGLNMQPSGFSLIAEEAGYVALPDPLIDVAGISVPLLNSLGEEARQDLEHVVAGDFKVLTTHPLNPYACGYAACDKILMFTDSAVVLVDAENVEAEERTSVDPLRRLAKVAAKTGTVSSIRDAGHIHQLSERARLLGALYAASQLLGLAQAMIDMATAYAKDRKQFGQPIGGFQAVKHLLSSSFVGLEFARPVVQRAANSLSTDNGLAGVHVSHAKIAATDAALAAAECAIQVHGAMGYTFEVDLHVWMKRTWALAGIWGDRNYHVRSVDQAIFNQRAATGPGLTFAASS